MTNTTIFRRALAAAVLAFALAPASAHAFSLETVAATPDEPGVEAAYASTNGTFDERFAPFTNDAAGEWEHELNDAWLGMTVLSADGATLGYVVDAVIDGNGDLDQLVLETSAAGVNILGPNTEVYLPGRLATLGDEAVSLSIDRNALAMMKNALTFASLE